MEKINFNNNPYKKYNRSLDNIYLKINGYLDPVFANPWMAKKAYNREELFQILNNGTFITIDSLYFESNKVIKNSIAMQLAATLIQSIKLKSINIKTNKILGNKFYNFCIKNLSQTDKLNAIDDNELLIIYLKQLVIIMRNTNLFDKKNYLISDYDLLLSKIQLYLKILDSFWNKSKWNELFPSMPETAYSLMKNKKLMIDLILKNKNKFKIADISNKFCNLTGITKPNDLFLISFLDFYFFTWLSHFGIISYLSGADAEPVEMILTEHGRRILKYLLLV